MRGASGSPTLGAAVRISEVARRSGVSSRMLRYYDTHGLLTPSGRTPAGYRDYTEQDLLRLLRVEGLRALGLTLQQVAATLDADAPEPEALIAELIAQSRDRLERERQLLTRLEQLRSAGPADWDDALGVVRIARGLESARADDRIRAALAAGAAAGAPGAPGSAAGAAARAPARTSARTPARTPAARPDSGSARLPEPALVSAILDEGDLNAAGALRWALAQSADGPAALAGALSDPDVMRRRRAIAAVADFPGEEAGGMLEGALADPDSEVRAAAALALGGRGDAAAEATLLRLVEFGPRDVEAAEALGVIARDPTAADRIVAAISARLAGRAARQGSRARLTQALGEFDTAGARALLASLTRDPDRAVSRAAHYLSLREQ